MNSLKSSIKNHKAKIAVIGLGYVGLPLCIRFVEENFNTIGLDIDESKIDKLNSGVSYINHISNESIIASIDNNFVPSIDFSEIKNVDVIIICVPTPLDSNSEPDLSFIIKTLELVKPYIRFNQLLILESTTYPGTTEEVLVPYIEKKSTNKSDVIKNLIVGKNFYVGYSPEREDPGNKNFSTKTIPKIVSGHTDDCLALTKILYDQIIEKTVPVSSTQTAEMTKILENIHRAVNIGLVNELKLVAEKMNINIFEVINAAATKPFGFTPYYPGPGLGGHCIPIDPFYLTWKAKKMGIDTEFIELAGKINTYMPLHVIKKTEKVLKEFNVLIDKSRILILGISYKKNVDDTRESPSYVIINKLMNLGAYVDYSDPFFDSIPKTRKYNFNLNNIEINPKNLKSYDLVLIATDHDSFDFDLIEKNSKLIIDTRGRLKASNKVFSA
jgi:UDP-N-acetyl-D-glucosamine dehydrogenase